MCRWPLAVCAGRLGGPSWRHVCFWLSLFHYRASSPFQRAMNFDVTKQATYHGVVGCSHFLSAKHMVWWSCWLLSGPNTNQTQTFPMWKHDEAAAWGEKGEEGNKRYQCHLALLLLHIWMKALLRVVFQCGTTPPLGGGVVFQLFLQ